MDSGYDTIATRLNLATVLQALDQYSEAEKILKDLQEQYPSDYRFDMQMAYLLIDWQGAKQTEQRDYRQAENSLLCFCSGKIPTGTGKRNRGYTDGSFEKPDRPAPHQRMAQIRREYLCLPDRFFCGWNRWHDRFGCCGSRFSMDPAQAGKKAEGTDLERVSIKINRLRGMKKC